MTDKLKINDECCQYYKRYKQFIVKNINKLFFLIILFSFISCNGTYKNCKEYRFSQDFKDFIFYPNNSYWIYYDYSFKIYDTVTFKNQTIMFNERCDYHGQPEEILTQNYQSSFYYKDSIVSVQSYAEGNFFNSNYSYPFGIFSSYFNGGFYKRHLDFIAVNSKLYKDIFIFNVIAMDEIYYWARNIGVIKKQIPKNYKSDSLYHFNLIEYKIK